MVRIGLGSWFRILFPKGTCRSVCSICASDGSDGVCGLHGDGASGDGRSLQLLVPLVPGSMVSGTVVVWTQPQH